MLENLAERLEKIAPLLNLEQQRRRLLELESQAANPELWSDQSNAVRVLAELDSLRTFLKKWDDLQLFLGPQAFSEGELSEGDYQALEESVLTLERQALLAGPHDAQGAILTIHAGTGGVDAQDWAEMLERMFLRYIEQGRTEAAPERTLSVDRSDWTATIVDIVKGEEAGLKKVVIEVQGSFAYGLLKAEAGVHRLVRLSPFNAKNLRQTSFALVEVIPEVEMNKAAQIDEKDLRIDVFRAGGHGGQGVNTTDSAVRLTHIPTGLTVSVQNERSQHQNKATALKILQSKLNRLQEVQNAEETAILKGEFKEGSWGNQIRSYVLQPYQLVKDHRTGAETADVEAVLNGQLNSFIESYLISKPA